MKRLNKKLSDEINNFIAGKIASSEDAYKDGFNEKLVIGISQKFGIEMNTETIRRRRGRMNLTRETSQWSPSEQVSKDKKELESSRDRSQTSKKYKHVLDENEKLRVEVASLLELNDNLNPHEIIIRESGNDSEATAIVLASDWHIEEIVKSIKVNGMNEFNLDIAKKRIEQFFQNTLKLVEKEKKNAQINTLILALLGDFITGNIHEEHLENCSLRPVEAMIEAQNMILSGIMFLLKNSKLNLVIPCHVGNHTRITKQVHVSTEQGNSLETFMYYNLKNYFRGNKRVQFLIAEGYHSYVTIYDYIIRFHHGHNMRYGGGVGGIFIPAFKAISQWQKIKSADLDCFGHFHQFRDGGNFVCNGSLIGYNSYALSIKADFELPKQVFFLVDKKRKGKTVTTPILFDC